MFFKLAKVASYGNNTEGLISARRAAPTTRMTALLNRRTSESVLLIDRCNRLSKFGKGRIRFQRSETAHNLRLHLGLDEACLKSKWKENQ